ncbi:hypothetical protein BKA70DRAFT_358483 [Coprinopsis sp. MPI-PUGE-AT-0042]|nr:hypothetical protein BKA70DRAFT_358483 [Coprinopsis sp. MPI-PUGE-AT-0042]
MALASPSTPDPLHTTTLALSPAQIHAFPEQRVGDAVSTPLLSSASNGSSGPFIFGTHKEAFARRRSSTECYGLGRNTRKKILAKGHTNCTLPIPLTLNQCTTSNVFARFNSPSPLDTVLLDPLIVGSSTMLVVVDGARDRVEERVRLGLPSNHKKARRRRSTSARVFLNTKTSVRI